MSVAPHTLPVTSESRGVSLYGDQILSAYVLASRAFSSSQASSGASLYQLSSLSAFLALSTCKLPHLKKKMKQGLPWWSSGKEFTAGDRGSISGWGTRIPHASEQLSTHNTNTEPSPSRVQSTTREPERYSS